MSKYEEALNNIAELIIKYRRTTDKVIDIGLLTEMSVKAEKFDKFNHEIVQEPLYHLTREDYENEIERLYKENADLKTICEMTKKALDLKQQELDLIKAENEFLKKQYSGDEWAMVPTETFIKLQNERNALKKGLEVILDIYDVDITKATDYASTIDIEPLWCITYLTNDMVKAVNDMLEVMKNE